MVASGRTLTEKTKAKMRAAWTPERKAEHSTKMKASQTKRMKDPKNRAKISAALTDRVFSKQHKTKIGSAHIGKTLTEETRLKISAWWTPEKRAEKSAALTDMKRSEESKIKQSAAVTGENNPNWQDGISFEPYCPRFNNQLKERIRNRDNRTCILCGTGEIQNSRRLSVHHIDGDKMQGCNHTKWNLCSLCLSCNSKPDTIEKEFLIVSNLRFLESQ